MRVIAGTHGGRRLSAPRGGATRPTSDRVREALFSILAPRLPGARVLDGFAGSGALGIEALSRGAGEVVFVDSAPAAIAVVRANLAALGLSAEVRRGDAVAHLRSAREAARHYDLALLDPPYAMGRDLGPALSAALPGALAPGALVVSESDRRAPLLLELPMTDERRYGDTLLRFHVRP